MHLAVSMTRVEGPDAPYDHNYLLGSAVLAMIRDDSVEAADVLHDGHSRKPYVLSEIHRVPGKPTEAWFRIGTSHERVANIMAKAFAPTTTFAVGPSRFRVNGVETHETVARPGEYVTLSPILLRDRETDRCLVHDDANYRETVESAANHQVKQYLKREGTIRILQFEPQAVRKRTIRGKTVLAQKGRFLMDGAEDELRMLVDHGLGRSPAMGFGMVVATGWGLG
ncbi:MAG: CRISPR-associated endoribonuclease Cas6 [Methanobacteriota archaeon]